MGFLGKLFDTDSARKEFVRKRDAEIRGVDYRPITAEVLATWFSASTLPDNQLKDTLSRHSFSEHVPTHEEICKTLFGVENVFKEYKAVSHPPAMSYPAHIGDKTLDKLVEMFGDVPRVGVECGSFIGSSAAVLGSLMKKNGGVLICVDTWCGDINMWLRDEFSSTMVKKDGNPRIYERFMNNCIENGLTHTVVPFRVSSTVGVRTLKVLNYTIDFVYVDSAHEAGETFMELSLFWNLLRPGGILLGDDYWGFPALKHDVDLFCKVHHCKPVFSGDSDTWLIKKPLS